MADRFTKYLTWVGVAFIVFGICFLIIYYYLSENNSCMTNPLVYSASYYEEVSGGKAVGLLYIYTEGPESLTILFNSSEIGSIS